MIWTPGDAMRMGIRVTKSVVRAERSGYSVARISLILCRFFAASISKMAEKSERLADIEWQHIPVY